MMTGLRDVPGAARRDEGAGQRFRRRAAAGGEQAVGAEHEHDQQQHEGEQVAVGRAEQPDAERLRQPQQHRAADRAGHVAHAADHLGDDALERRREAHRGVDMVVIHADQQAGQAAQPGRDGEHGPVHRIGVDAHLAGGLAILRGGADGPAEPREAQEREQRGGTDQPGAGDQQIECADGAGADLNAPVRQRIGQRAGVGREDELDVWSSAKEMPIVASSGAIRAELASGAGRSARSARRAARCRASRSASSPAAACAGRWRRSSR